MCIEPTALVSVEPTKPTELADEAAITSSPAVVFVEYAADSSSSAISAATKSLNLIDTLPTNSFLHLISVDLIVNNDTASLVSASESVGLE